MRGTPSQHDKVCGCLLAAFCGQPSHSQAPSAQHSLRKRSGSTSVTHSVPKAMGAVPGSDEAAPGMLGVGGQ